MWNVYDVCNVSLVISYNLLQFLRHSTRRTRLNYGASALELDQWKSMLRKLKNTVGKLRYAISEVMQ